jgi:hypothetical protein
VLQVRPGLVLADPLVHPIRLDQTQERLAGQVELANRRLHVLEHRPGCRAGEGGIHFALELVERREPVALVGVAELVDEPRVAIEGTDMRAQRAREENRADGEVLARGALSDLGKLHSTILA